MSTSANKAEIQEILQELLSDDTVVTGIMNQINSALINFRKEYLEADNKNYGDRVEQLESRMRDILANALSSFDIKTDKLYANVHQIAEDKVQLIVNGSLERINASLKKLIEGQESLDKKFANEVNALNVKIGDVNSHIDKVQKRTIHFAIMRSFDIRPFRTILVFMAVLSIVIGTALRIYDIELNIIQWLKALLAFAGIKV